MSIVGRFTQVGIAKSIDAQNNEGFKILPWSFGVSRDAGVLEETRTGPNSGQWYTNAISARLPLNENTIRITCIVPPGTTITKEDIKEIYVYAKDSLNNDFLLAIGQPTETIIYDPSGTVTLDLQISLVSYNITSSYLFQNTIAVDLASHTNDPNAHPEFKEAMHKAGMYLKNDSAPFKYFHQPYDEYPEFDGVRAETFYSGVTFTAIHRGTEANGKVITFDGVKSLDTVVAEFNIANPSANISHNSVGTEVLSGSATLSGGLYYVSEQDAVYRDVDNVYKRAIANGTLSSKVSGLAYLSDRIVKAPSGFVSKTTGFNIGDDIFLSDSNHGKLTNISTSIKLGIVVSNSFILLTATGESAAGGVNADYDAVVSNESGFKQFHTLQNAIDYVPNNGFILVTKVEDLESTVRTNRKTVNVVFRGNNTGLRRYLGQTMTQKILFSSVPDEGTWRIEFIDLFSGDTQKTLDLDFNITAAGVQSAIAGLHGHTGCYVTGDMSSGFTLRFDDKISLPLITYNDSGRNEIQRFDFSQTPDDGTCDFEFAGNTGLNFPFNSTTSDLKNLLEPLPGIAEVTVRGSFSERFFEIEFTGPDSLRSKPFIKIINSNLNVGGSGGSGGVLLSINNSTSFPISAQSLQKGRFPSSNLKTALNPVLISTQLIQNGFPYGTTKAVELDSNNCQFVGMGRIEGFETGINMSSYTGTRAELFFKDTPLPINGKNQIIGSEFSFDGSIGIEFDTFDAKPIYETPSGVIDGLNSAFSIQHEVNSQEEIWLFRDGLVMPRTSYSLTRTNIQIIDPNWTPFPGQDLLAWYTPDLFSFTPGLVYNTRFRRYVFGLQDRLSVYASNSYNLGSDRLDVFRNGVLMLYTKLCGSAIDQYQEESSQSIYLNLHAQSSDVFTFINKDYRVLSRGQIYNQSGLTVIPVPVYTVGTNSLLLYRNGLLMNMYHMYSGSLKYTELTQNAVELEQPLSESDVITFIVSEFVGTRSDVMGYGGNVFLSFTGLSNNEKLSFYKNGVLMIESTTLGSPGSRYRVVATAPTEFELYLEEPLVISDVLTSIIS